MNYKQLGQTDIKISEIGLGCWAIGGLSWEKGKISSGWFPPDPGSVKKAVDYAVGNGVTHFDTADCYGNGKSEKLLSESLGKNNKNVIIATKVGWNNAKGHHPYQVSNIKHQCEQSLINLKRDYIDIYYLHRAEFGQDDCYLNDACQAMYDLQKEGKIRAVGFSAFKEKDFKKYIPHIKPDAVQAKAHLMDYHFIAKNSAVMNLCTKYNISFIAHSPLNQGVLTGKYRSNSLPRFYDGDHRSSQDKFRTNKLRQVENAFKNLPAPSCKSSKQKVRLALQFVLYHKNVTGIIPGFRNINQAAENLASMNSPLNGEEIKAIRKAFKDAR